MKYSLLLLPCVLVVGQLHGQNQTTVATGTPGTVAPTTVNTVAPQAVFPTGGNQVISPSQNAVSGASSANTSGIPGAGSLFPAAVTPPPSLPAPSVNPVLSSPGGLPFVTSVTNLNGVTNSVAGVLPSTNTVTSVTNIYGGGGGYVQGNSSGYGVASGTGFTVTNGVLLGNNGVILNQNAGASLPTDQNANAIQGASRSYNSTNHIPRSLGTPPLR